MLHYKIFTFALLFFDAQVSGIENNYADYLRQRTKLIAEEQLVSFGANITLSEEEQRANDILMKYKHEELKTGVFLLIKWYIRYYRMCKYFEKFFL